MHTKQFFDLSGLILGERYVLTDKLGQGSWGTVYRARDRLTKFKKEYAVKCIWKESLTREGQKLLFREVSLHRVVSGISPHVLPLHCVLENSAFLFLVLDICSRGDMGAALHHNTFPSHDEAIRDIFLQILDGIEACHREGVYHRDIKPENVLFYEDGNACIADFGLATDEETSTEFAGTNEYLSPELIRATSKRQGYSPQRSDIWALGIVLINMVTGGRPWSTASLSDPRFQDYVYHRGSFFKRKFPVISSSLDKLLQKTLHPSPRRRITIAELRQEIYSIKSFYSRRVQR